MTILNVHHTLGVDGTATGPSTTISLTIPVVASGNLVVGSVQRSHNAVGGALDTIVSIIDDKGNAYNVVDDTDDATDTQTAANFWLNNITNGPSVITVTFANAVGFKRMLADEFSGVSTGSPLDGHTAASVAGSTSANAMSSGSITTTTNGDLIWVAFSDCQGAGATWSAGAGFTILDNGTSGDNDNMGSEWQVQSTAGPIPGTFTQNVSSRSVVGVIAFLAAGGGGPAVATLGVAPGTIFVPGGRVRGPARGLSRSQAFADPVTQPAALAIQVGRPQGFLFRPGSGVTWDIKRRSAFPDAAGGISVTVDFGGSFEFNSGVRSDGLAVLEYLASIRADSVLQLEALSSVRSDDAILSEIVAGLSSNTAAQLEFLASTRSDDLAPLEMVSAFRADVVTLMETLSGQRSDAAVAGEIIAALRADLVGPLENLGAVNVVSDGAVQIETAAALRSDSIAALEILPSLRIDAPALMEQTAASSAQAGALTETTGAVRSDSAAQMEMAGTLRADAAASIEITAAITSQSGATMENTAGVMRDTPVPQESLGGLSVIFSAAAQLEFLGVAINSAIEWILRARRRGNR